MNNLTIMEYTKDELKNAIMMIANGIGLEKSYEFLIRLEPIPEVVKKLAYDMFVAEFGLDNCSGELCDNYNLVLKFSKELETNGYVDFK